MHRFAAGGKFQGKGRRFALALKRNFREPRFAVAGAVTIAKATSDSAGQKPPGAAGDLTVELKIH